MRNLHEDLGWMENAPSDRAEELTICVHALERAIIAERKIEGLEDLLTGYRTRIDQLEKAEINGVRQILSLCESISEAEKVLAKARRDLHDQ